MGTYIPRPKPDPGVGRGNKDEKDPSLVMKAYSPAGRQTSRQTVAMECDEG